MPKSSRSSLDSPRVVRLIRWSLLIIVAVPSVAALVLGELFGFYQRFWWWDNMLHLTFGAVIAIYGFLLIYVLNPVRPIKLSPAFVALFTFSFAMMIGVIWEFFEFFVDVFFGANMQRWHMTEFGPLIGLEHQGNALRDTMSDLILNAIGALIPTFLAYDLAANRFQATFRLLQKIFPSTRG